jgi:DprA winged helix domain
VLCTTHHRLLHERKLEVSGDAEGVLDFRDARGDAIAQPAQLDVREPNHGATQGGSREAMGSDDYCDHPAARRLLQIMGRRGGWTMDALGEASGLAASEVSVGLLMLELGRRVQKRDFAFDPV